MLRRVFAAGLAAATGLFLSKSAMCASPNKSDPRVCVVGSSCIDYVTWTPRFPLPGETLHGSNFQQRFGGKGANQATAAAALGAKVSMITKLGTDSGASTIANFKRYGVDCSHVAVTPDAPSGIASIMINEQGQNSIVIVAGTNGLLNANDVAAARSTIAEASVMVCQLEVPEETTLAALREARALGLITVLNPAPAPHGGLPASFLPLCDYIVPNETELQELTRMPVPDGDLQAVQTAANALLDKGVKNCVVTLGAAGCILIRRDHPPLRVPAPAVKCVDTVGAGDSFIGAFAATLAAGYPVERALSVAIAVSADHVTRPGAQVDAAAARRFQATE